MMTSSNGNIFRVTGHLCGEFTGHRWIPRTKASGAELWFFFDLCLNKRLSKQWWAGDLGRLSAHYDVTVMLTMVDTQNARTEGYGMTPGYRCLTEYSLKTRTDNTEAQTDCVLFLDDIIPCSTLNENLWFFIQISVFLPNGFVNSLRPSDAYMRRYTNDHWFR